MSKTNYKVDIRSVRFESTQDGYLKVVLSCVAHSGSPYDVTHEAPLAYSGYVTPSELNPLLEAAIREARILYHHVH